MKIKRRISSILILIFLSELSLSTCQNASTPAQTTARVNNCAALFTRTSNGGAFEYTFGNGSVSNWSCKWTVASTTSRKGIEITLDPSNSNYDAFTLLVGSRDYPLSYRSLSYYCRLPKSGSYFLPTRVLKLQYTPAASSPQLPSQRFKISYSFKEDPRCTVTRKSDSSSTTAPSTVTITKSAAVSSSNSCFVALNSYQPSMGTEIMSIDSCNSSVKQMTWPFVTPTSFDLCELGNARFLVGMDDYAHYLDQLTDWTPHTIIYRFKQVSDICPTPAMTKNRSVTTYKWNSTVPRTHCTFEISVPQKGIEVIIKQQNMFITADTAEPDNAVGRSTLSINKNQQQISIYHFNAALLHFDLITKKSSGFVEIIYDQKQAPDKCQVEWTKNERGGKIVFPGASRYYYPNVECKWDLSANRSNMEIQVAFTKLDIYSESSSEPWCLFDFVSFASADKTVLDRVCQRSNDWPKTFHSSFLSVGFQSSSGNTATGFELVYTFKSI